MLALVADMRLLSATAIGIAATALIASPMMRPWVTVADVPLAAAVQRAAAAHTKAPVEPDVELPGAVRVVDELVAADTVILSTPRLRSQRRPQAVRAASPPPRRSVLARVFLGGGEHKPRPFPQPGS